jgi:hypothetical protein
MSSLIIKNQKTKKLLSEIFAGSVNIPKHVSRLNSPDRCIICGFGISYDVQTTIPTPLNKHHVSYFPELIVYVHYHCHEKIHNTPLTTFIQYSPGDSEKFYRKSEVYN